MAQLIVYGSQFSSEAVNDLSPYQSLSCGQRRCHSTVRSFFYILRIAPYRTTENSIRGLVITIIDSLSALAPPRDQDSARPVKNSPRGTASGGVFTGRGVPSPGENSLETGGSSVGMGGWGDSTEEAAVGGSSCGCCCRVYSPWTCMSGLRLSSMQPEICEYSMPFALCINVFSNLCLVLFRPAVLRRFNRNLAETQPIRLYTGKSVKFCP